MSESGTSLFVMLRNVLFDDEQQSAYLADPTGYLAAHGYDELDHDDVAEAMTLLADTLPPDQAALVSSAVSGTVAPSPTGDLSPVDQATFTINHVVDTVRDGPDAGAGAVGGGVTHTSTDPGAFDTGLDEVAAPVADATGPSDAIAAAADGGSVPDLGDAVDAADGDAALAELDELSAFVAPDSLVHGDPVDALLEDPGFGSSEDDLVDGGPDLGLDAVDLTAPATFDLAEPDVAPPPADGSVLEADLSDVGLDATGAQVGILDGDRPADLLDEDGF